MLFNFELAPLRAIEPWGRAAVPPRPTLHWFGLTDGRFWIEAGETTLFEYAAAPVRAGLTPRHVDYQVARLHEDLLEMLPHVLEPVPEALAGRLVGDRHRAWEADRTRWADGGIDRADDAIDVCFGWTARRSLDSGYLSPSAEIRLWSQDDCVVIAWDNRTKLVDGRPAWSATCGTFELSRAAFIDEVRDFDARLMAAMAQRIRAIEDGVLAPDIAVDLGALRREQAGRSAAVRFGPPPVLTDWERVANLVREVERGLGRAART